MIPENKLKGEKKMNKVLLVEDTELILRIMSDILSNDGYEVIEARDGEVALQKFMEEKPDVVVTDCLIPKMDGFKLVKTIREAEFPHRTPIMMLSAIYRKANYRQVAIDAGADAYIMKPSNPEERQEFLHKLNELSMGAEVHSTSF
jgi:DNA-binding response OmpR family regulator